MKKLILMLMLLVGCNPAYTQGIGNLKPSVYKLTVRDSMVLGKLDSAIFMVLMRADSTTGQFTFADYGFGFDQPIHLFPVDEDTISTTNGKVFKDLDTLKIVANTGVRRFSLAVPSLNQVLAFDGRTYTPTNLAALGGDSVFKWVVSGFAQQQDSLRLHPGFGALITQSGFVATFVVDTTVIATQYDLSLIDTTRIAYKDKANTFTKINTFDSTVQFDSMFTIETPNGAKKVNVTAQNMGADTDVKFPVEGGTFAVQADSPIALDASTGNITWVGSSSSPGGSDMQVQYNDGGTFNGDADLLFNKTTDFLSATHIQHGKYDTWIDSTPATITSNQNNYSTGNAYVLRLSSNASRNITGFANGVNGRLLLVVNVGSFDIVLQNQNTNSAVANRIITGYGADMTLSASHSTVLWYDATQSRWLILPNVSGVTLTGDAGVGTTATSNKWSFTTSATASDIAQGFNFNVTAAGAIVLKIGDASSTRRGLINTTTQSIAGSKTADALWTFSGGFEIPVGVTSGGGTYNLNEGWRVIRERSGGRVWTYFNPSTANYSTLGLFEYEPNTVPTPLLDSASGSVSGGYRFGFRGPTSIKFRKRGDWLATMSTNGSSEYTSLPFTGKIYGEFGPSNLPSSALHRQTTGATPDTIGVIEIPQDYSGLVEVTVAARVVAAGDGNSALYRRTNHYESNGAVVALVNANVGADDITSEQDASWDIALTIHGGVVYVVATGAAATTINWDYWVKLRGVTE